MSRVFALAGGLLALVGCKIDYGYDNRTRTDVFQQNRRNAVDMLVVIDNSCSMVEEQDNLAENFDTLISIFSDADVDWRMGVTTTDVEAERFRGLLVGGDDEIILRGPSGELDRIEYDRTWGFETGHALALDGNKMRFSLNDNPSSWCVAEHEYAEGGFGTPGEWNPACDGSGLTLDPPGEDLGPRSPRGGDLVVSEVMAQSPGLDSKCEWVELTNKTDDTLDLTGVTLRDMGRNQVAFAEGLQLAPRDALVVGRTADTAENCGAPVDVAAADGLSLMDDLRWIDRDTPDAQELFAEMVSQGTTGTGIEMGLEAARLVFEEPYYTEQNQAWLRDDASLSILFVSDENDSSPLPVDDYIRYFTDLKGDAAYRDRSLVNISAVVGKDPPPRDDVPSCETDAGAGWYGRRYLAAANDTQGLVESICAEDFAPIVTNLGLTLSGLALEFELADRPDPATLVVELYADESDDSLVRELVRDEDYTYDEEENLIRFDEHQVPPSEYYIVVEYELLARGQGGDGQDTGTTE